MALGNYPKASPATTGADGIPAGVSGFQSINDAQFAAALNYTHVFSPTFYSETTASQQWFYQYVGGGGADANPETNYEADVFKLPNNFGETGFPVICSGCLMPFGGTQYQYYENRIIFNYDENLTKTIGKQVFQSRTAGAVHALTASSGSTDTLDRKFFLRRTEVPAPPSVSRAFLLTGNHL